MSVGKLDGFLNTLRSAFMDGRWDELQGYFQIPLVVYSEAGVSVFRDWERLDTVLRRYRAALGETEVAFTTLEIEHRDTLTNFRFRATVRIVDFGEDGKEIRHSVIRYFLLEDADSYKVEMIEYIKASLPLSEVERIVH